MNPHGPTPDVLPASVLIVDDVPENLTVLGELLQGAGYEVKVADGGEAALRVARRQPAPDLILLDVMMPLMDGHEVLRRLRADPSTAAIPVMFLTALGDARDEEFGLSLGAEDYLAKPIQPAVVLARVRTQLQARRLRDWLLDQNAALEAEVARRMRENDAIQQLTIRALAHLAETRDPETGHHIQRTQTYVGILAQALKNHPRFHQDLTPQAILTLTQSAPLHDIGKVGIPDHILLKQGPLTPQELVIMRTHAALGAQAIEQAQSDMAQPLVFLQTARDIARWHHERWDGTGYPDGLAGEAIPVGARLMAVADVFDALSSRRAYKAPLPIEQARDLIEEGAGSQFDPAVVEAFSRCFGRFAEVCRAYRDDPLPTGSGMIC